MVTASASSVPARAAGSGAREIFSRINGFIGALAEAQSGRAFLWFVAFFAAGIATFFSWHKDPMWWPALLLALGGSAVASAMRRHLFVRITAMMLVAFALGHGAAQIRTLAVTAPILKDEIGPFVLSARVDKAEKRPEGNRIIVDEFVLPGIDAPNTPKKLRITIPSAHGLPVVGSRISVRATVQPPALPVVPGGFQFQRVLSTSGKIVGFPIA